MPLPELMNQSAERTVCREGRRWGALALAAAGLSLPLPAQKPVVGTFSLMEAVRVRDDGGFQLHAVDAAFLPESSLYTGEADHERRLHCVLRRGERELARWPFLAERTIAPFCRIRSGGSPAQHRFDEPGDYELVVELAGQGAIGRLPFAVEVRSSGDPFKPSNTVQTRGPWSSLAALSIPVADRERGIVHFRTWGRGGDDAIGGEYDELTLRVMHGGDPIYTSTAKRIERESLQWQCFDYELRFPDGSGGGHVRRADLCKRDGTYDVVIERAGALSGVWRFVVQGGDIVAHPRSSFDVPADRQLLPRRIGDKGAAADQLFWAEKLADDDAAAAADAGPAAVAGPGTEQRAAWLARSSADRDRPFALVRTEVPVRMDATIAAGDEIVAFGTGAGTGVQFLRVGEDQAQTIPDGQSFSSKLFCVAGRRIALTRGKQMAIFDTDSGELNALPPELVTLARSSGGMYRANPIAGAGMLVAVLNDPRAVADRAMVKVLDLSGAEPRIVSLGNPDIQVGDVHSIGVDPLSAMVVITSQRKGTVHAAPLVEGARFRTFDLSGQDGVHRDAAVVVADGLAAYMDAAGTARFRLLELATGAVTVLGEMGRTRPYYALAGGSYAFATKPGSGSAYTIALGAVGAQPALAAGTGDDGPGGGGRLGMGESIALGPGGCAFIAGEGGLGSGEVLQVGSAAGWRLVAGPDGQPIPASDVVGADLLVAFKTGRSNDTRVGYCSFGDGLRVDAIRAVE
jgi:hypothetical protein